MRIIIYNRLIPAAMYTRKTLHLIPPLFLLMALFSFSPPAAPGKTEKPEPMQSTEAEKRENTAFALDLYHTIGKSTKGNIFFSPYSISSGLSMTLSGAAGTTARQMADMLYAPEDLQQYHHTRASRAAEISSIAKKGSVTLETANGLFPQKGYELSKTFVQELLTVYRSTLTPVDYRANTEKARNTINRWVEQRTRNTIRELIQPGILNTLSRLTLVNAIYFKGDWKKAFAESETTAADFYTDKRSTSTVSMMHQENTFPYTLSDSLQILELPYSGEDISMLVLLPEKNKGLAGLEADLTAEKLSLWTDSLKPQKVRVFLPKFTMSSTLRLDDSLKKLGMTDAFDPGTADFSPMTVNKDKLFIGAVVHKAFVDVNEAGTEASAATGVVVGLTSAVRAPTLVFRADHPFLVLIRSNRSGSILFMGRVSEPDSD